MIENTEAILLVDDEPEDMEMMSGALRSYGYAVFEAIDYNTALEIFDQHHSQIDLLVSDVSLPGNNGCELAKKIWQVRPEVKVLFVSGPRRCRSLPGIGLSVFDLHFLQKPFHPEDLLLRVRAVLISQESISAIGGEAYSGSLRRSQGGGAP
jgi:two-component system, cell cycle sensor histidine kinase and response regulator CckA